MFLHFTVGAALRELSGRDPDQDREWLRAQQRAAGPAADGRVGEVAKMAALAADPNALLAVKHREFGRPLLRMSPDELAEAVGGLQEVYGPVPTRLALIAYLDPLRRDPDPEVAARAGRLLAAVTDLASRLAPALRGVD